MSEALAKLDDRAMLSVVTDGDCSGLNEGQRISYYKARCDAAGLDPRSQPFEFVKLQGKLKLYATKACTDQLSALHGVRATIIGRETVEGIHIVTVRAEARDGRQTEDVGAINIKGKGGDDLANAMMKTVTKAKRRAILSLCGLGLTDESELETIPGAARVPVRGVVHDDPPALPPKSEAAPPHDPQTGEIIEAKTIEPRPESGSVTFRDFLGQIMDGPAFSAKAEADAWWKAHWTQIGPMAPAEQKVVRRALDSKVKADAHPS